MALASTMRLRSYGASLITLQHVRSPNTRYLVGLDHLRAFASLLIVFYHGLHLLSLAPRAPNGDIHKLWIHTTNPFFALIEEGHTAVALFMVLSGFVFSVAALDREIEYFAFVKNRLLRIYPLFILLLLVGTIAYPASYNFLGVLQTLLFQADLRGAAYGGDYSAMFWAVAVEFQFYLLFPFLHQFIERYGARWALGCIALCITLRLLALWTGHSNARDIAYWHLIGRLDQFLIGMLAARVYRRYEKAKLPWGMLSLIAAGLVLVLLVVFNQHGGYPSIANWKVAWPTVEALAWAAFLLTYTVAAERLPAFVSRPLTALGTVSYSIYLLHFVLLTSLRRIWYPSLASDPDVASQFYVLCVVLPTLVPLAALSYYVVERPFLALRVRYLRDATRAPVAVPLPDRSGVAYIASNAISQKSSGLT